MQHAHTNQLVHETSPYLLQHAHNPVNWYPWGDEALQKSRSENKPILVSIGYAACHWCHVMERESFEDESTAELMNRCFVNIKIDREERPDLDHIYMDAVQAMTGSGGWPLNVFLTPDGKPFYGGTYFPPQRLHNRPSWKEILQGVYTSYTEKKEEILTQASQLTQHLVTSNSFGQATSHSHTIFTTDTLQGMADAMLKNADTVWGGFGAAPKFPQTLSIQYLLRHYHFTRNEKVLQQALLSLDKMINGGIYDQLGGGFARYSTDETWLIPHFEKMLYDNALLVSVMSEAFQLTHLPKYKRAIEETMSFIKREMTHADGCFYSALDADSEGVEGRFYTWNKEEICRVLGADASLFCEYYGITDEGNWEHTNILWVKEPPEDFAARQCIPVDEWLRQLRSSKAKLMDVRSARIRPQLDDKILLGWNALMNIACCKAYAALGNREYLETAITNMQSLETSLHTGDGWQHTCKNGTARIPAFLDDYAYLISACIHLQEVTGNAAYLQTAKSVTAYVLENFGEENTGFFFYTRRQQQDVIIRKKEVYDGATPSGNAVMARNLFYLSAIFNQPRWSEQTSAMIRSLNKAIIRYPNSFGEWAAAMQWKTMGTMEIAIVGTNALQYLPRIMQKYVPNKIIQAAETKGADFPLLDGKAITGEATFYLCKSYVCSEPLTVLEDFLTIL